MYTSDLTEAQKAFIKETIPMDNWTSKYDFFLAFDTALSFKIPSHYREMCYFIARAVRMERAQPLIFKKISVLKIWSSSRFLVTLWVNIKQLR